MERWHFIDMFKALGKLKLITFLVEVTIGSLETSKWIFEKIRNMYKVSMYKCLSTLLYDTKCLSFCAVWAFSPWGKEKRAFSPWGKEKLASNETNRSSRKGCLEYTSLCIPSITAKHKLFIIKLKDSSHRHVFDVERMSWTIYSDGDICKCFSI